MSTTIDQTMQDASQALARMDYLQCESLCLRALEAARSEGLWSDYARILLPMQEARRQRRMTAAEGAILLGTARVEFDAEALLKKINQGSIVVTHPHTASQAAELAQLAVERRQYVEVLFADSAPDADSWTLTSFAGPAVTCQRQAPDARWVNRLWSRGKKAPPAKAAAPASQTPADWFIDSTEQLGNVALAQVDQNTDLQTRVEQLEKCLLVVRDHELIHQALGSAARELAQQAQSSD